MKTFISRYYTDKDNHFEYYLSKESVIFYHVTFVIKEHGFIGESVNRCLGRMVSMGLFIERAWKAMPPWIPVADFLTGQRHARNNPIIPQPSQLVTLDHFLRFGLGFLGIASGASFITFMAELIANKLSAKPINKR